MAKTASMIHYFMGDSYMTTLAQETVDLSLAMKGYDKCILLKHDVNVGMFDLSKAAESKADVVLEPTRENFLEQLDQLDKDGYIIDLFIFSHGSKNRFTASEGDPHKGHPFWAARIEKHFEGRTINLRAVWQCNCYGHTMADTWMKIGAKVVQGTQEVNFYPTRWKKFIKAWNRGDTFGGACYRSTSKFTNTIVQLYMQGLAMTSIPKWKGDIKKPVGSVLGKHPRAEAYFRQAWIPRTWRDGLSGKQNMNAASKPTVSGNPKIRKTTVW